jgi:hypothetical protein
MSADNFRLIPLLEVDASCRCGYVSLMSAQEIIAELPKLKREELQLVKAQLDALVAGTSGIQKASELGRSVEPSVGVGKERLADFLLRVAGTAEGLPEDMAKNHDHYLYGMPKRHNA